MRAGAWFEPLGWGEINMIDAASGKQCRLEREALDREGAYRHSPNVQTIYVIFHRTAQIDPSTRFLRVAEPYSPFHTLGDRFIN